VTAAPYRIGQSVAAPRAAVAAVQGEALSAPQWFAFMTPPRREVSAQAWLAQRGVESWYPTEQRWRTIPRARVKRVPYEAAVVPRYIFARFLGQPQWHVLRDCPYLTGVVGHSGRPLPITDLVLAQMRGVPARIAEIRQREEERRRIRVGDRVTIRDGAMRGWVVEVQSIHAGIAQFIAPFLGNIAVEIEVSRLAK
jgi:transcription antitermination factor NusG